MAIWPLKFKEVFKIYTISTQLNSSDPLNTARNKVRLLKISFMYLISLICFIFLVNSIIFHDVRDKKFAEAIKNGIMAIVAVTVTFKHGILLYNQESIRHLINVLDEDYNLAVHLSEDEKTIVLECVNNGNQICHYWLIAAGFTSCMFPIKAFALMIYNCVKKECQLVPMFDLTYPKIINDIKDVPIMYCLTFAMTLLFDIFAGSVYVGFDPLAPIFMLHICGQLDLLGRQLSKALLSVTIKEKKENLKQINLKLIQIYGFVKSVQSIFVILYEFNIKTTTFLIPFSAFQIVESLRQKEITFEFIFFFLGAILHFYVPCYYSNLLMEKSESFRQAIYCCGWEMESDVQIRKTILLMLTRTSSPLVIRTVFYPICLDTFAEMTRQAYSIYNIMNAPWE